MSGVSQVSHVMCLVSGVKFHMSPVTNANSHSHRPSPCKLPIMGRSLAQVPDSD